MSRLFVVSLLLLAGCSLQMNMPEGFLRDADGGTARLRAITPEGWQLRVHEFGVAGGAAIDFWAKALQTEFAGRGYQLEAGSEIRDGNGSAGRAFVGQTVAEGQPCGYFVAAFVVSGGWFAGECVRVVEFAAPKAEFDARIGSVRAAVATLR